MAALNRLAARIPVAAFEFRMAAGYLKAAPDPAAAYTLIAPIPDCCTRLGGIRYMLATHNLVAAYH